MNIKKVLQDRREGLQAEFGELETQRQTLVKQQGDLMTEQVRLQGEARLLDKLEKELEE